MLFVQHAALLTPARRVENGALRIENGRIAAIGATPDLTPPPGARVIDATGLHLAPGFIELQLNGAFGPDFTADPDSIWQVAARLPRFGVTAFLPTIITSPPETIAAMKIRIQ